MYTVHLRLIGKLVVDFLLMINELLALGRLRRYERISGRSSRTAKHLKLVSELAYVTKHLDLPSSPHLVADFLQVKCDFTRKWPFCVSEPPLGG